MSKKIRKNKIRILEHEIDDERAKKESERIYNSVTLRANITREQYEILKMLAEYYNLSESTIVRVALDNLFSSDNITFAEKMSNFTGVKFSPRAPKNIRFAHDLDGVDEKLK